MILTRLDIDGFRSLSDVAIEPQPGLNLLSGRNGAGKSSVLEAIHCLSTGHSFRTRKPRELIDRTRDALTITARLQEVSQTREHRLGLSRQRDGGFEMRLDFEPIESLAHATRLLPVKALTPDSHALIQEGPDERRRFLDWGVFHVEPRFLATWKIFRRSLSQRNQALRDHRSDDEIRSWDTQLADAGTRIDGFRRQYVEELTQALSVRLEKTARPIDVSVKYRSGWQSDVDLVQLLADNLDLHRRMKTTTDGPHRADLTLTVDGASARQVLSRGEQKILVYMLHLAQLDLLKRKGQTDTVLLCDDLLSELDSENASALLKQLVPAANQVFITGIELDELTTWEHAMFHVEHGDVSSASAIS